MTFDHYLLKHTAFLKGVIYKNWGNLTLGDEYS
jgi:hypothetical protein